MRKDTITKRLDEFLEKDKTGEGAKLSKDLKDALVDWFASENALDIKKLTDETPMTKSLPQASASVGLVNRLPFKIGVWVYYILFKQVKFQEKTSISQRWGWQYAVLKGKTEEFQLRADYGVSYKINGDWVLLDHVFADEKKAIARCNDLNQGTSDIGVDNGVK